MEQKPLLSADDERRAQLSGLIAPFTLRRKKESVLDDLPENIEDLGDLGDHFLLLTSYGEEEKAILRRDISARPWKH